LPGHCRLLQPEPRPCARYRRIPEVSPLRSSRDSLDPAAQERCLTRRGQLVSSNGGRDLGQPVLANPCVEVPKDLLRYKATAMLLAVGCVRIGLAALARRAPRAPARTPSWDAAWFIPVYAWGIESLHHAAWWVFGGEFFPYAPAFIEHGALSIAVLAGTVAFCMAQERAAWHAGLPARAPQFTIPLPLVAGIVGVLAVWSSLNIMFWPIQ
jgi:hypothetical protein